jgi:hypothetical protein
MMIQTGSRSSRRSMGILPQRAAGESEEDVVERRVADRQCADLDAGIVERAHQRQRLRLAVVDGDTEAAVGRRDVASEAAQGLGGACRVVDLECHEVARDPALELGRRALGDDLAVIDDEDAIAERVGLLEVVRGEQDRRPALAQAADVVPEVRAGLRIEPRRRLVEEHELGVVHEAEGDVEAAALAAGERLDEAVAEIAQIERLAEALRTRAAVGARDAVELGLRHELLVDLRGGVRPAVLGDVAELAAHADRIAPQIAARDGRLAGRRPEQRREHPLRRRLAGAVRAEQADELAGLHVEIDAAHGLDHRILRLERAGEPASLDHGPS